MIKKIYLYQGTYINKSIIGQCDYKPLVGDL